MKCQWCSDEGSWRKIRQIRYARNGSIWRMPAVKMFLCTFCAYEAEGIKHPFPKPRYVILGRPSKEAR